MEMSSQAHGSALASPSDFLAEFRSIQNKLKKRFLRKPNVSEASEQFAKLAKRMHCKDEPQYEGLCHLAVARCEQSANNSSAEAEALIVAARTFLRAEKKIKSIGCNSLEDNFQMAFPAIQSYKEAIWVLEDSGRSNRAAGVCVEVAMMASSMGKLSEATTFYQRAADFCLLDSSSGLDLIDAKENTGRCLLDAGDFQNALQVYNELANLTELISGKPVTSVFRDILVRCEIIRLLLLLLIDPTPQMMSPSETSLLQKYSWESSIVSVSPAGKLIGPHGSASVSPMDGAGAQGAPHFLPHELFMLLQSLVMAVQLKDIDALYQLEDCLMPYLEPDIRQLQLLRSLVSSVQEKGNV